VVELCCENAISSHNSNRTIKHTISTKAYDLPARKYCLNWNEIELWDCATTCLERFWRKLSLRQLNLLT
jgi:hypothetical protein